jgi:hypothetical protein
MLAIVVYRLHRQQENLAERHRASFDSMSKRLQGLDDRLAILTLSVGNQPARVGSVSASTAQAEENEAANSSLQAIRQEIERLTTQLGEQDYSGCIGADAQHDKVKNAFTETKSNRG